MNILAPANALFGLLIGAILLLYILRLKRRERVVSSTMLWQNALRDLQANAPWQKLRSSMLMWLQIAFVVLCVLALIRPAIRTFTTSGQNMAIILDASASMEATDVAPSRFGRARNEALRLVNSLASGDAATILSSGAQTRVLAPLTRDKNVLKAAINNARTQDTGCNLRDAVVLASSLLQKKRGAQIYVLSDGAVPPLQDLSTGATGLQFVKIGQRNDNLAITALDARRSYAAGSREQIFATVRNFSARQRTINLQLLRDGELVAVRPLTVTARGQQSQLFDDFGAQPGTYSVRFQLDDDLASDNIAYTQIQPSRPIRVLMVSSGNLFLERALNINPDVRLFQTDVAGFAAARAKGDFDVTVYDGAVPSNAPGGNQLVFGAVTSLTPVQKTGFSPAPAVADWDRKHPVTQFAPWNDVRFAQTLAVRLQPWGQALVEAERTPLVVAGERGGQRVVWCGFRLNETDLPLRVAFPIFITNAVRWLSSTRGNDNNATRRTGQVVPLDVPQGTREVAVTTPDNSVRRLPINPSSATDSAEEIAPLLFAGTDRVGQYAAQAGDWKRTFAVSLLNAAESDLQPRDALRINNGKAVSGEGRARSNRELWGFFVAAALLLLGLEWWIYHRGV